MSKNEKEDEDEKYKILFADTMRDSIHNLDLSLPENEEAFYKYLRSFIILHEGIRYKAYDDATGKKVIEGKKPEGNVTIGVGFNMSDEGAKAEWDSVFQGTVSFDDVRLGKLDLTPEQTEALLMDGVLIRVEDLKRTYKGIWDRLCANEKAAIISLYFNGGKKVVGSKTNFHTNIVQYVRTSDTKELEKAVFEAREQSNLGRKKGIEKRRKCEAALLDSRKAPFYSRPGSPLISGEHLQVILGKTIVPVGMGKNNRPVANSEYFIWRTQMDDKVRLRHLEKEGKVFRKSDYNDGNLSKDDYNCRCYAEDVTVKLNIIDSDEGLLSKFIRYGGGSTLILSAEKSTLYLVK